MQRILSGDDSIGRLERIRLVMLYIISQGMVPDSVKVDFYRDLPPELSNGINNLKALNVDMNANSNAAETLQKKRRAAMQSITSTQATSSSLALMRYQPY